MKLVMIGKCIRAVSTILVMGGGGERRLLKSAAELTTASRTRVVTE
jgi:hypothetical protein